MLNETFAKIIKKLINYYKACGIESFKWKTEEFESMLKMQNRAIEHFSTNTQQKYFISLKKYVEKGNLKRESLGKIENIMKVKGLKAHFIDKIKQKLKREKKLLKIVNRVLYEFYSLG